MALSLQDPVLAKRRFFHAAAIDAAANGMAIEFWRWLMTQGGKPQLQVVEFASPTADVVIADAPCTVYAVLASKPTTTAATLKASNHASTQAASTQFLALSQSAVLVDEVFYPKGHICSAGVTISSDTTPDGTTDSAAGDGANGVFLIGQ
jgi:hypothetical protein